MNQANSRNGVPSSASAHWPGQDKTARYLLNAVLIEQLEAVGFNVIDYGDLLMVRFQPDNENLKQ